MTCLPGYLPHKRPRWLTKVRLLSTGVRPPPPLADSLDPSEMSEDPGRAFLRHWLAGWSTLLCDLGFPSLSAVITLILTQNSVSSWSAVNTAHVHTSFSGLSPAPRPRSVSEFFTCPLHEHPHTASSRPVRWELFPPPPWLLPVVTRTLWKALSPSDAESRGHVWSRAQ